MNRIALTGGIGSGKSVVSRVFTMLGIAVYDSDSHAKCLMSDDIKLRDALCETFGDEIYENGVLCRAKLASKVFKDKKALEQLNSLVHPAVMHDFEQWAEERERAGDRYVIMESAVLFENGLDRNFDYTVVVTSPLEVRIKRCMIRDGASREQIEARMNNQLSDKELTSKADYVICKDEDKLVWEQVLVLDKIFGKHAR